MSASSKSFRRLLFADLSLAEVLEGMSPKTHGALADAVEHFKGGKLAEADVILSTAIATRPDEVTVWHLLLMAGIQIGRGREDRARRALERATTHARTDSRTRLFAWNALRALGATPPPTVEGVIVEVPSQGGYDLLAAYADRHVRYFVATGGRFVWDFPDARLDAPVRAVIEAATASVGDFGGEAPPVELPVGVARQTILTHAGPRVRQESLEALGQGSPGTNLFAANTKLLEDVLAIAGWA